MSSINPRIKAIWNIRLNKLIEATKLYRLTKKEKGALHPFVTGLIFSSMLIDEINQDISTNLSVTWGQALNEEGDLSKEIDIIIFHGKPYHEWKNIGYSIIPSNQIKAVFEVKGYLSQRYAKYEENLSDLKQFSPFVYLCVLNHTCKNKKTINKLRQKLIGYGFDDVFFFVRYLSSKDWKNLSNALPIKGDWYRFLKTIRKIK